MDHKKDPENILKNQNNQMKVIRNIAQFWSIFIIVILLYKTEL